MRNAIVLSILAAGMIAGCDSDSGVPQSVVDEHMKAMKELIATSREHATAFIEYKRVTQQRIDRLASDSTELAELRAYAEDRSLNGAQYVDPRSVKLVELMRRSVADHQDRLRRLIADSVANAGINQQVKWDKTTVWVKAEPWWIIAPCGDTLWGHGDKLDSMGAGMNPDSSYGAARQELLRLIDRANAGTCRCGKVGR